ncbi:MAG: transposase [Bacteroidota bacterium]|nr:transposase [Bacteroidota bacterium]
MNLETDKYYHFYDRSNNNEIIFKEDRNYNDFLERYKEHTEDYLSTFAYCLMPTHFHFLVKITTPDIETLRKSIASLLSGYTKSLNRSFERHGSLFQPHSKAKEIDDKGYLLTVMSYIHQNPLRAGLVKHLEEWKHSSYPALAGLVDNPIVDRSFIRQYFPSAEEFKKYSEEIVALIKYKYWI